MSSATLLSPVRPKPTPRRPAADPAPLTSPPADRLTAAAVSAAVGGPDRFAARTPDAVGFLTLVAAEAVRHGDRLLLVTPAPDRWTRRLGENLAVLRAVAPGEAVPEDLLPRTSSALAAAAARGRDEAIRETTDQLARWDAVLPLYATASEAAAVPAPPPATVAAARDRLLSLREQWQPLAPLCEAKKSGRVATGAFWKAVFTGDVAARAAELEKQIHEAEATVTAGDAADAFRTACTALRAAGLPAPDEASAAAVGEAAGRAQAVRRAEADRLAAAVAERADLASGRLPLAPVVVAAADALTDQAVSAGGFDRVLFDTDGLSDDAVSAALALAPRAVLAGTFDGPPTAAAVWADLPKPAWAIDAGRLTVRLEPLADVRFEPLADRPDVLIGFGTRADGSPAVAAVSFPADGSVPGAVELLAAELGEVRLLGVGPSHWHPDDPTVCWPLAGDPVGWVEVEPGVSVGLAADRLPLPAAVRFDPGQWSRPAAEDWLAGRLTAPRAVCLAGRG